MNILVINAGSSSLKFAFFKDKSKLISGNCERIGSKKSFFRYTDNNGKKEEKADIPNHQSGVKIILNLLESKKLSFEAIGHRVVHGGPLEKTSLITAKVEKIIEKYSSFAPLHNPYQLKVIKEFKKFKKRQYAVFDTAFFANIPDTEKIYPIPWQISKKYNLRRYGFHGSSHRFVSEGLKGKTITCHLGNGSSISAIKDGKVISNSMGLTPLAGVMMATRPGDLDPGLVLFLKEKGYDMEKLLNFQSGFKSFSPYTDLRDIFERLSNPKIKLAFDIFINRIVKYIGAYSALLNGLDNLVFTAGIGENSFLVREKICQNLSYLGVRLDNNKNKKNDFIISSSNSKVKVYVKKTDEETIIANQIVKILENKKTKK